MKPYIEAEENKPKTIRLEHEDLAPLAAWLRCYPFMRSNPRLWFVGYVPTLFDRAAFPELFRHDGSFKSADEMRRDNAAPGVEGVAA